MNSNLSIVIPTWNGLELLQRFLPSVLAAATSYRQQSGAGIEIIIVDDASEDGTRGWLQDQGFKEEPGAERRLLHNDHNMGFGNSCNRGFASAKAPLVLLLNNDVEVEAESLQPLTENFADPRVFAAHCHVLALDRPLPLGAGKICNFSHGFIRVHRSFVCTETPRMGGRNSPLYSAFAGGGAAMFDREKFLRLGGFERLLSPFYWEDVELSYRAWKRGYVVVYEPRSIVRHQVSSTIKGFEPRKVRRIEQRNRLIYHWIHLQDRGLLLFHVIWILILLLASLVTFRLEYFRAFFSAAALWPQIRQGRDQERRLAVISDREVLALFRSLTRQPGIIVYDNDAELERKLKAAQAGMNSKT